MPVGYADDAVFLEHYAPYPHPECPDRLSAIRRHLQSENLISLLTPLLPRDAAREEILLCHTKDMVIRAENAVRQGTELDADTYVNARSLEAAFRAAGSVLTAVDAVLQSSIQHAFCAVRPPGHHAESDRSMGFCLFNNVAIGARYAIRRHGLHRIMILDWDVHHGNGTQEIFYDDPDVFYMSIHQSPLYPGTGHASETGTGRGMGTNRNFPVPAGTGDAEILTIWNHQVLPAVREFDPDLVILSAGFDAHHLDPLAQVNLTSEAYGNMTRILCETLENTSCRGIVSVLEGGYHLDALGSSVVRHVQSLVAHAA